MAKPRLAEIQAAIAEFERENGRPPRELRLRIDVQHRLRRELAAAGDHRSLAEVVGLPIRPPMSQPGVGRRAWGLA